MIVESGEDGDGGKVIYGVSKTMWFTDRSKGSWLGYCCIRRGSLGGLPSELSTCIAETAYNEIQIVALQS